MPSVRRQKNEGNDAEVICTRRAAAHLVGSSLHDRTAGCPSARARQPMVNCCAARELEPGPASKSITRTCRRIPKILADAASELTTIARGRGDPSTTFFRDLDRGLSRANRAGAFLRSRAPDQRSPSSRRSPTARSSRTAGIWRLAATRPDRRIDARQPALPPYTGSLTLSRAIDAGRADRLYAPAAGP
jgi:hypothetical protein